MGIALGLGETDNVGLTATQPRSQTIALTEVDFGVKHTGAATSLDLAGDLGYLDYLQNAYSGLLLGRFDGLATLSLWSDRIKWIAQDDFGQTPLSAFTPATPNNLENLNVATTGPDLELRPAVDTYVRFGARYSLSHYQESRYDGHRETESAAVGQRLSAGSGISLNTDVQQVRFNDTLLNTNFTRQRLYGGYYAQGARTELALYAGIGRVEEADRWSSIAIGQIELTRRLWTRATLKLTAGREYTDLADSFRDLRAGALGGIFIAPLAALSPENYLSNYASAGLSLQGSRTRISLTGRWERDTYGQQPSVAVNDVSYGSLQLKADRRLSRTLTAELQGSAANYRYANAAFGNRSYELGAALIARPAEHLEIRIRYTRDRASGGFRYVDNTGLVTIAWRPLVGTSVFAEPGVPGQPAAPLVPSSPFGPGFQP